MRAQVTSVSFLKKASGISDLVQVRYTKSKRLGSGGEPEVTHWIATLQYVYAKPSSDPQTRSWNPLGFKITYFHPESEVAAPQTATASTTTTDSSANGTKQ